MSTPSRAALLGKIHKVLKKHYKVTPERGDHPVLESLLFASLLENAKHDLAHQVFDTVRAAFFDWNEVRVTTVKELAEVMHALPEPVEAAARFKGVLQSVFESEYSFDLESLRKQNIGQAVKRLHKFDGATPFGVAYVTQMSLGGHAIPLDRGALGALVVLGAASEAEGASGNVPGLERAIPKSKGHEFAALLHELGAEHVLHPYSPNYRELLLSINPEARDRLPKRSTKKPEPTPAPVESRGAGKKKAAATPVATKGKQLAPSKKEAPAGKKAPAPPAKKKPAPEKKKSKVKALAKRKPR